LDVVNYGAIKNLDKKLGLSMGEVGTNFGMTSGQFLMNFDGFDEVNSVTGMTTLNKRTDYGVADTTGLIFPYTIDDINDHYLYGFSLPLCAFVRHNLDTQETTVIKNISVSFLADLKTLYSLSYPIYPDFGQDKLIVVTVFNSSTFTVKVIDVSSETIETYSYTYDAGAYTFKGSLSSIAIDSENGYIYFPVYVLTSSIITSVGCYKISTDSWERETIIIPVTETSTATSFTFWDVFIDVNSLKMYFSYQEASGTYRKLRMIVADIGGLTYQINDITVENCTAVYGSTESYNYYKSLGIIGMHDGKIIAVYTNSCMIYPYKSKSECSLALMVYIDTKADNVFELKILDKEVLVSATKGTTETSYSTQYSNSGLIKPKFLSEGDELLICYISYTVAYMRMWSLFNVATKTKIDFGSHTDWYGGNSGTTTLYLVKILEWDWSSRKFVLFTVTSVNTTSGVVSYGILNENDESWQIETTGETLMAISKIAYQGASFDIEIDGKQFTKKIPSCSSSDLRERQVLLHSKTGIKFRSNDTIGIDEVFWGVKASA